METIRRELVYIVYYFTAQLRQIAGCCKKFTKDELCEVLEECR